MLGPAQSEFVARCKGRAIQVDAEASLFLHLPSFLRVKCRLGAVRGDIRPELDKPTGGRKEPNCDQNVRQKSKTGPK